MTAADGAPHEIAYARGEPDTWKKACPGFEATAAPDPQSDSTVPVPRGDARVPIAISGTCPRCGHVFSQSLLAQTELLGLQASAADGSNGFLVTCNCVGIHPGRSDGVYGCGAQGGVTLTPKGPGWTPGYVRLGIDERDADDLAEAARRERLPRLRTFAQQWATAFGAVAGLVTFGAVVGADDAVRALQVPWSYLYVASGGLALLFAALTVLYASRAAGLTKKRRLEADVQARLSYRHYLIATAKARLTGSYWWAALAVIFFVVSMGIRYFAPVIA